MIFAGSAVEKSIYVADSNSSYTDATTFKSAMNGVMLYYELATPIETDITAYLTTDTVQTIPSGTIEFANQNGEDYKIPVPSTEKWQVGDTDSDRTVLLDNGKVAEKLLVAGDKAPLESPFFVGKPQAPNPMVGDVSNQIATTQWVYDIVRKLEERIASLE